MSAFIAFAFRNFTSSCWPTFSSPDLLCKTPHPSFLIPGMIHRLSFLTIFKTFWGLHHLLELTITCFDSRWIRWRRLLVQWAESRPTVASQLIFEFFSVGFLKMPLWSMSVKILRILNVLIVSPLSLRRSFECGFGSFNLLMHGILSFTQPF